MTGAGFPHSDTLVSTLGWQLPEAYRSLPRPSSAPGAKASTVCPQQLDHPTPNQASDGPKQIQTPTRSQNLKMLASTVQFSKYGQPPPHHNNTARQRPPPKGPPTTTPADACSLRTQQCAACQRSTHKPHPEHHAPGNGKKLRKNSLERR